MWMAVWFDFVTCNVRAIMQLSKDELVVVCEICFWYLLWPKKIFTSLFLFSNLLYYVPFCSIFRPSLGVFVFCLPLSLFHTQELGHWLTSFIDIHYWWHVLTYWWQQHQYSGITNFWDACITGTVECSEVLCGDKTFEKCALFVG